MKHANRLIFTIITSAVILLLSSCQVTQKMELTPAMGGKSTTDLVTDDFFEGVIEDLSTWTPDNPEDAVMETAIKSFVEKLNTTENAFLINFDLTKEHEYDGTFRFKGLEPLFTELTDDSVKDLLKIQRGRSSKIELSLNMDNWDSLTKIIPFLAEPEFEVYGPVYNHDMTEQDYLEMISFILGEDGPESINNSYINLTFDLPGNVKETNGTLTDSKTVNFRIPLINILLLKEDIDFYAVW